MDCYMGIDLGTSSVRALLIDSDGNQIGVRGAPYDVLIAQPGYAEQDPRVWYQKMCEVIGGVMAASGVGARQIRAISFSGQMHGLVPLKADGTCAANAILWLDQRSAQAVDEINERLGRDWIAERTQNAMAAGFLAASLYWARRNDPAFYRAIERVCLPKDYVKYRLCGRVVTDCSDAAGSLAFDNARLAWSDELLSALGLGRELFPEVLPSTAVVGEVSAQAARDTGLAEGTLVINGGADQPMQAIGNGIIEPGTFASNIGTAGQVSTVCDAPIYDRSLRTNTFAHVVPDRYNVMGACLSGGISRRWFAKDILRESDYDALNRAVEKAAPGAGGLIFLPYLAGERTPHLDPKARGMFFGLTLGHGRAEMERAVMEGVVYALKDCLRLLLGMGLRCDRIVAAGGGARGDAWLQMQADIFERPVYRSASSEQACLGAALTAAVGAGQFADFSEACRAAVRPPTQVFTPIEAHLPIYREMYDIFGALYPANKDLFARAGQIGQPPPQATDPTPMI